MPHGVRSPLHLGLFRRIADLRIKTGLTTQDLAIAAGITPAAWGYVEDHGTAPRLGTVERMAAALGVDPGWLAFGPEGSQVFVQRRPRGTVPAEEHEVTPAPGTRTYAGRCERFGERLKSRRNEIGITFRALAEQAGISTTALVNIEKGAVPKIDTCETLARALGVPPARLAFGDE